MSSTPAPDSLRAFLRDGTSEQHRSLDDAVNARGYLRTHGGYQNFLARSLAFQSAAEEVLQRLDVVSLIPDWPQRRRAPLLAADLATLSGPPPDPRLQSAARQLLAPCSRAAHAWGIAYVLEGSTLGAAFVLKEVAKIGVTATQGGSFLASGKSGPGWPAFLAQLDTQVFTKAERADVLDSARRAFAAAHACFAGD